MAADVHSTPFILTGKYPEAMQYCFDLHQGHLRKGSNVPYISHLLAVSALVLEYGGNEDEAIAALLHDAVEDCGGLPVLEAVKARFGGKVADIVLGCSDSLSKDPGKKEPWHVRKERYLDHLRQANASVLLVAACDKLHNLSCTVQDLEKEGPAFWTKFNSAAQDQVWFYQECVDIFRDRGSPLSGRMEKELAALTDLIDSSFKLGDEE